MAGLLVENSLPGVTVIVNAAQVGSAIQRQPTSTAFVVGYSPWGPVNLPRAVTSWTEFVQLFGGFDANSFLDDFCHVFFNLFRGSQAVVCRVVGAAATKATLSINDREAGAGADPTLKVDAKYPSSRVDIRITIENGTAANTFKLKVRSIFLNQKEEYDNLKVDAASIDLVNQKSKLVTLTNLASGNAAPSNLPLATVETLLTGGNDDFAGITAATFIGTDSGETKTGLQAFKDESYGSGQVAIPGITTTATHAALAAHAEAYHRTAFPDPPLGSDKDDVVAIRALHGTWYAALYWPWVQLLDHEGTGLTKFYPPSCFAAGACARADRTVGTHKAPANVVVPTALDVERYSNGQSQTDEGTREFLNKKDINVITPLPERGVVIYGARVMTADRRVTHVHQIRLLSLFYYSFKIAYAYAVFAVVNASLFRELVSVGKGFLRNFWRAGALYGETEEDAFIVVCDTSNNPPEELDAGRVHVQVGVKISRTAETIIINMDNVPLSQSLSVLQQ